MLRTVKRLPQSANSGRILLDHHVDDGAEAIVLGLQRVHPSGEPPDGVRSRSDGLDGPWAGSGGNPGPSAERVGGLGEGVHGPGAGAIPGSARVGEGIQRMGVGGEGEAIPGWPYWSRAAAATRNEEDGSGEGQPDRGGEAGEGHA